MQHQDRHHVGARAEEGGMPEAHHAAEADNQIEAARHQREDQNAARQHDIEGLIQRLHDEREPDQRNQPDEGNLRVQRMLEDGSHQPPRAGNSPCGRQNSTAAIST